MDEGLPAEVEPTLRHKKSFAWLIPVLLVGFGVFGVWLYNELVLQKPLQQVIASNPKNQVLRAGAHFDGYVNVNILVFDLKSINGEATQLDVLRVLLQYAKELQTRHFQKVVLSAFGQRKFEMSGDYFQQLGREYDSQNPMYTIRTIAHHVNALDGSFPFPEYEGGLFAVLAKEMEQFTEMNKRWYLDDLANGHK
jgi:hypothetical protein